MVPDLGEPYKAITQARNIILFMEQKPAENNQTPLSGTFIILILGSLLIVDLNRVPLYSVT